MFKSNGTPFKSALDAKCEHCLRNRSLIGTLKQRSSSPRYTDILWSKSDEWANRFWTHLCSSVRQTKLKSKAALNCKIIETERFPRSSHIQVICPLAVIIFTILHVSAKSFCVNNSLYNVIGKSDIMPIFPTHTHTQHQHLSLNFHTESTAVVLCFICAQFVFALTHTWSKKSGWNRNRSSESEEYRNFHNCFTKRANNLTRKLFPFTHPLTRIYTHTQSIFWSVNSSICLFPSNSFRPFKRTPSTFRNALYDVKSCISVQFLNKKKNKNNNNNNITFTCNFDSGIQFRVKKQIETIYIAIKYTSKHITTLLSFSALFPIHLPTR